MRALRSAVPLALSLLLCGVAAGCRSLPNPPAPVGAGGLTVEGWECDGVASSAGPRFVPAAFPAAVLPEEAERAAAAYAAWAAGVHAEAAEDFAAAETWYDRAAAEAAGLEGVDDEEPLRRAVAVRLASRKFGEVAEKMEAHYRAHPDRPAIAAWLVQFYFSADERERAGEIARDGVRDHPRVADFWSILAGYEAATGETASAIATLRKGLSRVEDGVLVSKTDLRLQLTDLLCPAGRVPAQKEARKVARENLRALWEENAPPDTPSEGVISWDAACELYAKLLVADGDLPRAVAVAHAIEKRDPENLGGQTRLALLLSSAGADADGLLAVAHAKKTPPEVRAAAAAYAGVLLAKAGRDEAALAAFREALAVRPDDIAGWLRAAAAARKTSGREAAERMFEAADAANPASAALAEGRGRLASDAGDHAAACRAFARAAELAGADGTPAAGKLTADFPFLYACELTRALDGNAAGGWLARCGEDAIGRYLAAFAGADGTADPAARRALLMAAAEACGSAAQTHPDGEDEFLLAKGFFLAAAGKPKKTLQALAAAEEAALARPTGRPSVLDREAFHYLRAVSHVRLRQFRRAEEPLQRCLALNPNHAEALNTLAYLWACRGENLPRAERYVRRALAQEPENAAYRDTLAWVLHRLGRDGEALAEIVRARETLPRDQEIDAHWREISGAVRGGAPSAGE